MGNCNAYGRLYRRSPGYNDLSYLHRFADDREGQVDLWFSDEHEQRLLGCTVNPVNPISLSVDLNCLPAFWISWGTVSIPSPALVRWVLFDRLFLYRSFTWVHSSTISSKKMGSPNVHCLDFRRWKKYWLWSEGGWVWDTDAIPTRCQTLWTFGWCILLLWI